EQDRLRLGALVHAVERGAVARGEQCGDGLVRADHELLHERVGFRLALALCARDSSPAVEREADLRRLDTERAALETGTPKHACPMVEAMERIRERGRFGAGDDTLGLSVRQPGVAADDGAVERRLAVVER